MLEELKEIIKLFESVPTLSLWILGGFAFYKLVTYLSVTGSVVFLTKLAIEKLHDYKTKPKEIIKKVTLDNKFITSDGAYDIFCNLLDDVIGKGYGCPGELRQYIHESGAKFIADAVKEKIERLEKNPPNND